MSGTQRLVNLLELANQGPTMRAALAEEVAEMLTDWPKDCPAEMRLPCEALLARAAREVDEDIRARLRVRLFADPALAARVLPRESGERALIAAAREGHGAAHRLAQMLGVTDLLAEEILADTDGRTLALACKSAGVGRAGFSALALLTHPAHGTAMLESYENASTADALRQLRQWRGVESHAA